MAPKLVAASDHAGLNLRRALVERARARGIVVLDLGPATAERVDYPDFARLACEKVLSGEADLALLVCGTGIGMSISANKLRGIRAAHCVTEVDARMARAHNDANAICIGERVIGPDQAAALLDAFLATSFEGGRHQTRVDKIMALQDVVPAGRVGG